MPNEKHFINKTDEMIEEFIAECEREAAKLEITVDYYLANGEEYAYLFENNEWVCYTLPYEGEPYRVNIPEKETADVS